MKALRLRTPSRLLYATVALATIASSLVFAGITATPARASVPLTNLRTMNYFPANSARGGHFWDPSTWNVNVIDADFALIASLHANSVRIFVPTDQFGYPSPTTPYTTELSQVVQRAANHGLAVYLTLFQYRVPYTDIAGSEQWANGLIAPYVGDSRLAAIEVQNEIDPANASAISWAKTLIPYVRSIDGGIPVAISICGCDNAGDLITLHSDLGSAQPDLYSFHYYTTLSNASSQSQSVFQNARNAVAPIPLVIGETGFATGVGVNGLFVSTANSTGEQQESQFYSAVETSAHNVGLSPVSPWILYDYVATPGHSSSNEDFFGLYHFNGSAKAAAAVVASAFGS